MHLRIYFVLVLALFVWSCDEDSKLENEISKIDVNFDIERFDNAFAQATPKDLPNLKDAFPFLFSKHIPDSVWVYRMQDTLRHQLHAEVQKTFPDLKQTKIELKSVFQHLKYYQKTFTIPRVITLTNDVDYRSKTIVTDSIVLIALDNFLGAEHPFYQNIPRYLAANMQEDQIISELVEGYAKKYTYQSSRKTLLDEMIYFGKLLYFKDVILPNESDARKIGYTDAQIEWSRANESQIWSYFIEKELLYSTDNKLPSRFIAEAPFSKFYLELDNQSPGRLGQYIGWQIVRAYANTTAEDPMSILQKQPDEIFRKSKFKPKK